MENDKQYPDFDSAWPVLLRGEAVAIPLSYVCEDCGVTMPHNVTLMDGHFRCEWCHVQARAQQSKESTR